MDDALKQIRERCDGVTLELQRDDMVGLLKSQRHLDAGTPERAYWHHGYMTALLDVLRYLGDEEPRN